MWWGLMPLALRSRFFVSHSAPNATRASRVLRTRRARVAAANGRLTGRRRGSHAGQIGVSRRSCWSSSRTRRRARPAACGRGPAPRRSRRLNSRALSTRTVSRCGRLDGGGAGPVVEQGELADGVARAERARPAAVALHRRRRPRRSRTPRRPASPWSTRTRPASTVISFDALAICCRSASSTRRTAGSRRGGRGASTRCHGPGSIRTRWSPCPDRVTVAHRGPQARRRPVDRVDGVSGGSAA